MPPNLTRNMNKHPASDIIHIKKIFFELKSVANTAPAAVRVDNNVIHTYHNYKHENTSTSINAHMKLRKHHISALFFRVKSTVDAADKIRTRFAKTVET